MAPTVALLGVGRLNNFRLNALSPALVTQRETKIGIILNGADVRGRVRRNSLTIRDAINDAPNAASLTVEGPLRSPYADQVLTDQALAYWRLGDVGTTAFDQTGRGHTGTVLGAVVVNQPGAVADGDRSMAFPGTVGARVEVATAADLALTAAVTVEAWVKTDRASQQGGIVEKTIGGAILTSYLLYQDFTSWVFSIVIVPPGGGTSVARVTVPVEPADVGQWVHLVGGWYNGANQLWLYKNGVVAGISPVGAGPLQAGAGVLEIGHLGSNAFPFTGTIDEVAIYAFLSATQIAAHFAIGRAITAPTIAQDLRITIGVDNPTLLFNGALTQVDLTYEGRARTPIYHCAATDDTARANRRRPFGQWTNVSATVIAQALIANFVPGFGSAFVQAGLPPVTVIFDGSEGMNRCLTQITNLIGGYWYFQDRQLHLFLTESSAPPDPIDDAHPFLHDPAITQAVEMSQVRTRVYGRGHGEALLSAVLVSETLIPIASTVMFSATGGRAIALGQILTYTGAQLGGLGSLIGPGAAPSVAPTLTLTAGAGLGTGLYTYAYTDTTAAGESLAGPSAAITVGLTAAPVAGPTAGAPTIGTGPDPGAHSYAVTYVTTSGETTPGPSLVTNTGLTPGPTTSPTLLQLRSGTGLNPGSHEYAMTFSTAIGETSLGPSGPPVVAYQLANPTAAPTVIPVNTGNFWPTAAHTFLFATQWLGRAGPPGGESSSALGPTTSITLNPGDIWTQQASGAVPADPHIRGVNVWFSSDGGATWSNFGSLAVSPGGTFSIQGFVGVGTGSPAPTNTPAGIVLLENLPLGDANVTSRKLYRRFNGAGPFKLVVTIANNTATTYTDLAPNASLGTAAPVGSTAALQRIPLTLPIGGDALVAGRKIYRTVAGGAQLKLAATIADNTTTTWLDTITDAALGANAPAANTATANRVTLSAIAVGAASVTGRKIYRTVANGAQLKLLTTLADNTTLTYLDSVADGSLGANLPVSDTSGLTQPQGQVNAGSTTLPTASAGPFLPTGGWALIGTQAIRYTGITGNALTGIPVSGPGALVATVRYGDHILAAPMLTGVSVAGGLIAPVGTVIYLWIQRDDAAAQTAMAARDGGDGIYEYLVQDERRGEPSLTALCDAHLTAYKTPITTVTYATRDLKTKSGKPVLVNLAAPPIVAALVIQDVTIDQIDLAPGLAPRFSVVASTVRFSLEDLLRQLAGSLEGA